jgi:hypothetical protein
MKNLIFTVAFFFTIVFSTFAQFVVEIDVIGTGQKEYIKVYDIDTIFITNKFVEKVDDDEWLETDDAVNSYFINERPNLVELSLVEVFDTIKSDTLKCVYLDSMNNDFDFVVYDSICNYYELVKKEEYLTKFNVKGEKIILPNITFYKEINSSDDFDKLVKYNHITFMQFNPYKKEWVVVDIKDAITMR